MVFKKLIEIIEKKSPFQKKAISQYLSQQDISFWEIADYYTQSWFNVITKKGLTIDSLADSYLSICEDTLREQIAFSRTGKYSMNNFNSTLEKVYNNQEIMFSYMLGLGISQFLWPNHYKIFSFFREDFLRTFNKEFSYLEIGPGHGLYLQLVTQQIEPQNITAIDISKTSLEISKEMMAEGNKTNKYDKISLIQKSVFDYHDDTIFDRITMGEVLEHVEHPEEILLKISQLLNPGNGLAFITTCANCPAIDHIFHFKNINEIQALIKSSKLNIVKELVLPIPGLKVKIQGEELLGSNYAAIVKSA